MIRSALLRASESGRLARWAPRLPLARRAVRRFLPGERVEDALAAASRFQQDGLGTLLTRLGENVRSAAEADEVRREYERLLRRIEAERLPAEISVKPTHLGQDVSPALCADSTARLGRAAAGCGGFVWLDMESASYTDATLELYRAGRAVGSPIGVCLQANLRRTPTDLDALLTAPAAIRLVKGAYREPAERAHVRRREVDAAYAALATRLLRAAGEEGARVVFGTHDVDLLGGIERAGRELGVPPGGYEIHMLYGIRNDDARALAARGHRVRILISYGDAWFAWFVRRLAEKPGNLLLLLR